MNLGHSIQNFNPLASLLVLRIIDSSSKCLMKENLLTISYIILTRGEKSECLLCNGSEVKYPTENLNAWFQSMKMDHQRIDTYAASLIIIESHPIWDRVAKDFLQVHFIKLAPNELQRSHPVNVLLDSRNRNHSQLQNQVEHICLQGQCENPEIQIMVN